MNDKDNVNPFSIFKYLNTETVVDFADGDFSKLSDEQLIERHNAICLATQYINSKGIQPLRRVISIFDDLAYSRVPFDMNEDSIITWGPVEINELQLSVKQLRGIWQLIGKLGMKPLYKAENEMIWYCYNDLKVELYKRGISCEYVVDNTLYSAHDYYSRRGE